jgi:hypothetical protein
VHIDQVAIYSETPEEIERIKALFGLQDAKWISDTVTAMSSVYGSGLEQNIAELLFNYDLGVELEILRYVSGPSWHDVRSSGMAPAVYVPPKSFISHIGIHLEDSEEFPPMPGCELVQETWTQSHTSKYLVANGRTYHYKIFELSPGSYIKYIKRIHAPLENRS